MFGGEKALCIPVASNCQRIINKLFFGYYNLSK